MNSDMLKTNTQRTSPVRGSHCLTDMGQRMADSV